MTYTDRQTNAPPIAIVSTAITCTLIGGIAGAHMGMSRNVITLENAQTNAQQATQNYQACQAFVESRDVAIDQINQQFDEFITKTRGQQQ